MAITVNGRILRNLPEQVSKNTEDIIDLQEQSNIQDIKITALEGDAIALATFQDCTFTGTTAFQGPLNSSSGFTFSGNGSIGGNLTVAGSSTLTGNVTASGSINAQNLIVSGTIGTMDKIVDANGNKRFQEWNLTTPSIAGLNVTYAKASLSGTHFMFVVGGKVEAGSTIAPYSTLAYLPSLPAWMYNKIIAIFGNRIEQRTISITNEDDTSSSMIVSFNKVSPNNLFLQTSYASSSYTKNGNFRIQFDLLIDNE